MPRAKYPLRLVLLWILAGWLLAGCFSFVEDVTPPPGWKPTPIPPTPVWEDFLPTYPLNPEQGATLYAQHCTSCHGPKGLGDGELAGQLTIPPTALGKAETQKDATALAWFQIVTEGRLERQMPPFGRSLSDRDRWNVLAYVFTLALSPEARKQAQQQYTSTCASCHGPQGRGDGPEAPPGIPDLTDPQRWAQTPPAAWARAILDKKGGAHAFPMPLTQEEALNLALYLRELAMTATRHPSATATASPTPEATASPSAGTGALPSPTSTPTARPAASPTAPSSPTSTPQGTLTITIRGQVRHAEGHPLPPDMTVRLQAFDQQGGLLLSREAAVDADGSFIFRDIPADFHTFFLLSTEYQGVSYISESVVAVENQKEYQVTLQVYETTTQKDAVRIQRLHVFVEAPQEDRIRVAELYILENTGKRTVVAASPEEGVLKFSLPDQAEGLIFPQALGRLGERFRSVPGGFVDTEPIRPGQTTLLFSYLLPYEGSQVTLEHAVPLPVDAVTLLTPPGFKVQGEGWQSQGTRTVQTEGGGSMTLQVYLGPSLQAGDALRVTLSGSPRGEARAHFRLPRLAWRNIVVAVLAVLVVLAGLTYWHRRAPRGPMPTEPLPPSLAENPEALMDAILALDALYEAGEIEDEVYRRRRAAYKARLQVLLQKPK